MDWLAKVKEVLVRTPHCPVCSNDSLIRVPEEQYKKWIGGAYVHEAFPEMRADQREMLLTGTHPKCWEAIFNAD